MAQLAIRLENNVAIRTLSVYLPEPLAVDFLDGLWLSLSFQSAAYVGLCTDDKYRSINRIKCARELFVRQVKRNSVIKLNIPLVGNVALLRSHDETRHKFD